ncbi:conjugal transfer protein TraN [Thorsellia anophelis]|uniref:Type-1V conjugative transfer system mating pair stabilisation n=1 Tax=Thorsellia anophelis DSM 18579 TaxID=1123402 RepID=A0A1I0D155_9GAMM|nr:conjugal transfer protein TraN [Thorsellia anophelis]SET25476.1 Type-1V conjugative transfer system mating pair stabilisation [Thorsellia anophelis DSM 18579]
MRCIMFGLYQWLYQVKLELITNTVVKNGINIFGELFLKLIENRLIKVNCTQLFKQFLRRYALNLRFIKATSRICLVICMSISLIIQPSRVAFADRMSETGWEAQQFAETLLDEFKLPIENTQQGQFTIDLNGENMLIQADEFFPEIEGDVNLEELMQVYGNNTKMVELGQSHQSQLDKNPSLSGSAYQLLNAIEQRSRPDLTDDAIWSISDFALNNPNGLTESFDECDPYTPQPSFKQCDRYRVDHASCEITHHYEAGVIFHAEGPLNLSHCGEGCLTVWLGEVGDNYWHGNCSIFEQEIKLNVVNPNSIISAKLDYAKWDDYMQVWIGNNKVWSGPNDNFPPETAGACELNTDWERQLDVDLTEVFKEAGDEPLSVKIRVSVTGYGEGYASVKIHYDPNLVLLKDDWQPASCIDTAHFIPDHFKEFDISCLDMPNHLNGCSIVNGVEVCENQFKSSPIENISTLCRKVQVSAKDESYFLGSNLLCSRLEKQPECGFYSSKCTVFNQSGECQQFIDTYDCAIEARHPNCVVSNLFPDAFEGCVTVENIIPITETKYLPDLQQCEQIFEVNLEESTLLYDGCQQQVSNPNCKLIEKICIDDETLDDAYQLTGQSNSYSTHCKSWHMQYDCGKDVLISNLKRETHYQCDGPIRCMGHDCLKPHVTEQANFAEALAKLNLAQDMTNDLSCTPIEGNSNVNCQLFKGEAASCKKAIGGIVNCCDTPSGISLSEYISLLSAVNRLDTIITAMDPSSAIYGSWHQLRAPVTDSWHIINQSFSSSWDALMGASPSSVQNFGAEQAATQFLQTLTNQTASWVGQTFGAGAQSALFTNVGGSVGADGLLSGGQFTLGGAVGTVLGGVMTAYMIYSVTLLLIKIIWQCEQNEFELGVKKELKSCHFVGAYCHQSVLGVCTEKKESYCCYSSPLGRIFQEQVKRQLNDNFGQAKSPNCDGMPIEVIQSVDRSKINLDEWLAILSITGHLNQLEQIDIESLTNQAIEGMNESIIDRLNERLTQ